MIGEIFEQTDYQIVLAVEKRLEETLTTEQLISCMDSVYGTFGLTQERHSSICEMLANGKIKLVNSAWIEKPEDWVANLYKLGKKPKYIHVDNYKKMKELRKNKDDWDKNWRDYIDKYEYEGFECYNQTSFYVGEHCSRNSKLVLNRGFLNNLKLKKFQFMIEVFKDEESWSSTNLGQEYVFEFVGENSQNEFVETFRSLICRNLAEQLVNERQKQLLEEEVCKTTALFGTIIDKKDND